MKDLLQPLISLGGFGYFNYWVATRISDIDLGGEQDKNYLVAFLTSLDYTFYLIVSRFIDDSLKSILVTIAIIFIFSICLPFLLKLCYKFLNLFRKQSNLIPSLVKDEMFNDDKDRCFIFDFEGHLISSGAMGMINGKFEEFSVILYPYFASHEEYQIKDEDSLYQFLDSKNLEARIYMNFEKRIKIIYF